MRSCTADAPPSLIQVAISVGVESILAGHVNSEKLGNIVRNTLPQVASEPQVLKTISDNSLRDEALMVPIASFVSIVAKREKDVTKDVHTFAKQEVSLPPTPSSSPPS